MPESSYVNLITFLKGFYFKLAKIDHIDFVKQLYTKVPKKLFLKVVSELSAHKLQMALQANTAKLSDFLLGVDDREINRVWSKEVWFFVFDGSCRIANILEKLWF